MIESYNKQQVVRACVAGLLSLLAYAIAYYVLAFVFWMFVHAIGFEEIASKYNRLAAAIGLVVISIGGVLHARKGLGHSGYEHSTFRMDIDHETGGSFAVDFYSNRVTTAAYVLTQVFLAGPLQFFKARDCLRSRIKDEPNLEMRLATLQVEVEAKPKRHGVDQYPGRERDVLLLARMGKINFSPRKGTVFRKE